MRPPTLPTDYLDAMYRHWDDAELLWGQVPRRFANADQLYGLAAECGLKAIMTKFVNNFFDHSLGMPSNRDDRVHIDGTWNRYRIYSQGGVAPRYALPPINNPFVQWEIADRYANQGNFRYARVREHRSGCLAIKKLVDQAKAQRHLP